jgi:capsule polysaccharide export protein KpsE/RkpR
MRVRLVTPPQSTEEARELLSKINDGDLGSEDAELAALLAFRQSGVEEAEKERDEALEERNLADQIIASLESELAEVKAKRAELRNLNRVAADALEACAAEREALRARLSPERLKIAAEAIWELEPERVVDILAVLQRELNPEGK